MVAVDFDRILRECPGTVQGVRPQPGAFGFVDVEERRYIDAIRYLRDRGCRYVSVDYSPVRGCCRLRFKFGMTSGLVQRLNAEEPIPENEWAKVSGRLARAAEHRRQHPSRLRRLGRAVGLRRKRS